MLKRPLWVVMAVLCIVFSSASKKLIELKMAPYASVSAAVGKKIKDGSRDKRQYLTTAVAPEVQSAPDFSPQQVVFLSALICLALIYLSQSGRLSPSVHGGVALYSGDGPLYLQYRKIRV